MPNGIVKRGKKYHIDTTYRGVALRESTGATSLSDAKDYYDARTKEIYDLKVHGKRPESKKVWLDGVEAYVREKLQKKNKPCLNEESQLRILAQYIPADMLLNDICNDTFAKFRQDSKAKGNKNSTINRTLEVARAVLNYCCKKGPSRSPWVVRPPYLDMENTKDKRQAWILDANDEKKLLDALPDHLRDVALLILQTALRSGEALKLKWEWLHTIPELGSVFMIPASEHKNGEAKPVCLNATAEQIIRRRRGQHDVYVFTYHGKPLKKMARRGWHTACKKAGLWEELDGKPHYPIPHDLRKTVNTRLKHLGIHLLTRKMVLGHTVGDVTEDVYAKPTLEPIKEAVDKLVTQHKHTLLRAVK